MSVPVAVLLGLGGLLAAAAVLLVTSTLRRERAQLTTLADQRGWDHQPTGPATLMPLTERVLPKETHPVHLDYFAGPTAVGPFRLNRIRLPRNTDHPRSREATLMHIRTPLASPGLHVRPDTRFSTSPSKGSSMGSDDRFSRLYETTGTNEEFLHRALDPDTRDFITAPRRTIRLDWLDHDLVIAFPFAARTPRAVEALVSWSTALASRLNEAHAIDRGRASPQYRKQATPHPDQVAHSGLRSTPH